MKPLKLLLTSLILLLLSVVTIIEGQAQITPGDSGNFITTWKTTSTNESITIPTSSGSTYNYSVAWGDGNIDTGVTGNATHTYTSAGTYTVEISGTFPRIYFNNGGDKDKIISIDQWGSQIWSSKQGAFFGASNLTYTATDNPDLSAVTNMNSMFWLASSFNGDISGWDVSSVTNMSFMFSQALAFNQDIGGWDVSSVTDMSHMFSQALAFNQDIGDWDVSKVIDMSGMFSNAQSFNQDIGFDPVTNEGWNVSSVIDMNRMFQGAYSFNQNIGGWDVSNVTNMNVMFNTAAVFNKDISGWDVSSVTSMVFMFNGATAFNQNIGGWDVSSVNSMRSMFRYAAAFNQDIGGWDVSSVNNMYAMFFRADVFNQDISGWDVSSVNLMSFMFYDAAAFNQDLGGWNIGNVIYGMNNMFDNSGLSTENYDNTLIGWEAGSVQNDVALGATGLKYCSGKAARQSLISNHNWTISDDGLYPGCELLLTGGPGFRMLSSPSQVTLAELLEPLWTQGASGADYPNGNPNVWRWDISTADWLAVTDLSETIPEGTGILVHVFDEDELGNPSSAGFPKTLIADGTPNSFPLTLTPPKINPNAGGFALLGNPVKDGISWDNGINNSDIDDVVYVWDPNKGADGDWVVWSGGAGDLTGGVLHPFQGFFVRTSTGASNPSLQMFSTTSSQDFYGKQASEEPVTVRLHMKGEEGLESTAWLRFSDQGSLESNRGDALKLLSFSSDYAVLGLSSRSEESPLLALKHLPINLNSPLEIPLVATATRGESFTLEATRMSIPEEWSLTLRDTHTGAQMAVELGMNYNFKLTENEHFQKIPGHNGNTQGIVPPNLHALSNPAKQAEDSPVARFILAITQEEFDGADLPETFVLKQNYPNPFNPSTVISYQLPTDSRVRLEVFDMIGRQVATLVNETVEAGQHQVDFNAEHLTSGVYLYRLQTDSKIFTKKLTLLK